MLPCLVLVHILANIARILLKFGFFRILMKSTTWDTRTTGCPKVSALTWTANISAIYRYIRKSFWTLNQWWMSIFLVYGKYLYSHIYPPFGLKQFWLNLEKFIMCFSSLTWSPQPWPEIHMIGLSNAVPLASFYTKCINLIMPQCLSMGLLKFFFFWLWQVFQNFIILSKAVSTQDKGKNVSIVTYHMPNKIDIHH